MLSRRSFFGLAGAVGLSATRLSAQRGRSAEPTGPLPPGIAALTSEGDTQVASWVFICAKVTSRSATTARILAASFV